MLGVGRSALLGLALQGDRARLALRTGRGEDHTRAFSRLCPCSRDRAVLLSLMTRVFVRPAGIANVTDA
jgi:hypothetical protein